jgi:hypothetical protein
MGSRTGRVVLVIAGFLVATLVVMVPVGILGSSNLVWGEPNQDGRVPIPGKAVVHLPAGTVEATVAIEMPAKGNETVDLPLPSNLSVAIFPVGGGTEPTVSDDLGDSGNAGADGVNVKRRVWSVDVPQDGDYRVRTRGDFTSIGIDPQLWFGHGPPLKGTLVPLVAAGIVIVFGLVWFAARLALGRGRDRREPDAEGEAFEAAGRGDPGDPPPRGPG